MQIDIYTTTTCGYCGAVKKYLSDLGHTFNEHNIDDSESRAEFKQAHPDLTTVPQIFIDKQHVGGFTDLLNYSFD